MIVFLMVFTLQTYGTAFIQIDIFKTAEKCIEFGNKTKMTEKYKEGSYVCIKKEVIK